MPNTTLEIDLKVRITESDLQNVISEAMYSSHSSISKSEAKTLAKEYLANHAWKIQLLKHFKHIITQDAKFSAKRSVNEMTWTRLSEKTLNKISNYTYKHRKT
jgi:archaellin